MGKISRVLILIAGLFFVSFLLASCTVKNQLPQSALDKLEETWLANPYLASIDLNIINAWPGEISAEQSSPEFAAMEIWCVELEMPPNPDSNSELEPMIWYINRIDPQSDWSIAPLMVLSSSWPYEACGFDL